MLWRVALLHITVSEIAGTRIARPGEALPCLGSRGPCTTLGGGRRGYGQSHFMMGRCKNVTTALLPLRPDTRRPRWMPTRPIIRLLWAAASSCATWTRRLIVDSPGCTTEEVCAQFIIIMLKLYTKAHKYHDSKIFYQLKLPSFFSNIKNDA